MVLFPLRFPLPGLRLTNNDLGEHRWSLFSIIDQEHFTIVSQSSDLKSTDGFAEKPKKKP